MKFTRADTFVADWRHVDKAHRPVFATVAREEFSPACDVWADDPSRKWPAALRVKPMKGHPGLWEMTWSFAGPDGRATFDWVEVDEELVLRWRRIGDHRIYQSP